MMRDDAVPESAGRPATDRPPDRAALIALILDQERAVLGAHDLAATDDFFAAGGDSVLAVEVMERVGARLGRDLPIGYFFTAPTAEDLADAVTEAWEPAA